MQNQKAISYGTDNATIIVPQYIEHGTGSLVSSENDMMATILLSSLGQSLDAEHLARYERLCQAAEYVELAPHALPKEHMVRDFTQWFHGWLVQNEQMIQRRERALATYEALTAKPIVMGPATSDITFDVDHDATSEHALMLQEHALMPVEDNMPAMR